MNRYYKLILILLPIFTCFCTKNPTESTSGCTLSDTAINEWRAVSSPTTEALFDIFFIDNCNGWIIGEKSILKTQNGGTKWEIQKEVNYSMNRIQFVNKLAGWIGLTDDAHLLKTTNGGTDWNLTEVPDKSYKFYFLNENEGCCTTNRGIYKSSDGGNSWIPKLEFPESNSAVYKIGDIFFLNELQGWAVFTVLWTNEYASGFLTLFYYSKYGGESWQEIKRLDNQSAHSIQFCNEKIGYFTGSSLKKSLDGGLSWSQTNLTSAKDFQFVDTNQCWAIREFLDNDLNFKNDIFYSQDGGENWKQSNLDFQLNSLFFRDADNGWAVGKNGAILKY